MKKILLFFCLIALTFVGFNYYQTRQEYNYRKEVKGVQAFVVYQQIGTEPEAKYTQLFSKTALDLLMQTATIKTKGEGKNAFVTEINGRAALDKNKEFWAFYVNGQQAKVGAGSYNLQNGDKILWKIENY